MGISKPQPRTEIETLSWLQKMLPSLLEGLRVGKVAPRVAKGGYSPDLLAEIKLGPVKRTLAIEVKRIAEPRLAEQAIFELQRFAGPSKRMYPVLAAAYIPESARRICKSAGVGYIDLVGNIFLQFDGILVDKTTTRALRLERRYLQSLSPPKTSHVIRKLLNEPKREFQLTGLARESGVSAAQAYKVANLLEARGFIRRTERRLIRVTRPGELLEAWASASDFGRNQIVRAFLLEQTPEATMRAVARTARRVRGQYAFTMFAGASLVAPFVRPSDVTTYVLGDPDPWLKELDARIVESGSNVQLVVPRDPGVFSDVQTVDGMKVVSNVQLFADLYKNPARGREQAEFLRERVLRFQGAP